MSSQIKAMSMSLKVNSFARFTDSDGDGKFSYVGKVVSLEPTIDLDCGPFIIHCPQDDLPLFKSAKKPRGWKDRPVTVARPKAKAAKKSPASSKPAKTGSKRDLVEKLVAANPGMSRKEHIAFVVSEIGMTPAGASTYVSGARKLISTVR